MNKSIEDMFNESAASYDEHYIKTKSLKDALHLCMKAIITDLPAEADILCVGAGTGQELLYLAKEFPNWNFTVVEPASAMLSICERKADKEGIAARCNFHEGYIETLPKDRQFHAATSILVSQFLIDTKERCSFFAEIADRLQKNGLLITADLAANMGSDTFKSQFRCWSNMLDIPPEKEGPLQEQWKNNLAVVPEREVSELISSCGFSTPILFFRTFFIHGWYARV